MPNLHHLLTTSSHIKLGKDEFWLTDGKVSVDINENQLNILITFTYNKLLGRITIKYVDAVTGAEIAEPDVMDNLEFGTYEVQPKYIKGYELSK